MKNHEETLIDAIENTKENVCYVRYRVEIKIKENEDKLYEYEYTKKYRFGKSYFEYINDVAGKTVAREKRDSNPSYKFIVKNKVIEYDKDGSKAFRVYEINGEESTDGVYYVNGRKATDREMLTIKEYQKVPKEYPSKFQDELDIPLDKQIKPKNLKINDILWIVFGDDIDGEKIY